MNNARRGRIIGNSNLQMALGPGVDVIFLFDVSKSVRSGNPPLYVKAVNFAKAYVQEVKFCYFVIFIDFIKDKCEKPIYEYKQS